MVPWARWNIKSPLHVNSFSLSKTYSQRYFLNVIIIWAHSFGYIQYIQIWFITYLTTQVLQLSLFQPRMFLWDYCMKTHVSLSFENIHHPNTINSQREMRFSQSWVSRLLFSAMQCCFKVDTLKMEVAGSSETLLIKHPFFYRELREENTLIWMLIFQPWALKNFQVNCFAYWTIWFIRITMAGNTSIYQLVNKLHLSSFHPRSKNTCP
jgi:hypothetical protein